MTFLDPGMQKMFFFLESKYLKSPLLYIRVQSTIIMIAVGTVIAKFVLFFNLLMLCHARPTHSTKKFRCATYTEHGRTYYAQPMQYHVWHMRGPVV